MAHRVLVYPSGTEIGLEIHRSLRWTKDIEVVGLASVSDHAASVYEHNIVGAPYVGQPNVVDAIAGIVREHGITQVFPAHDDAVVVLAEHRNELEAIVLAPDAQTCRTTRSKRETYERLEGAVRTPAILDPDAVTEFPVFVKPDRGQGSVNAERVDSAEQLRRAIDSTSGLLTLEHLPGDEFTVDCFTDRLGRLRYRQARTRERTLKGISARSRTVDLPESEAMADQITAVLPMRGAWFFQVKRAADSELALLEVGARVAGTMGVSRIGGVNLPLLTVYDAAGIDVNVPPCAGSVTVDRAISSVFAFDDEPSEFVIDLDDTLLGASGVNPWLVALVYYYRGLGLRVTLVTRHTADPRATLRRNAIDPAVFDRIIHITDGSPKSAWIPVGAFFVDDSYRERRDAMTVPGVRAFDVGEAVALLPPTE